LCLKTENEMGFIPGPRSHAFRVPGGVEKETGRRGLNSPKKKIKKRKGKCPKSKQTESWNIKPGKTRDGEKK